jgi:Lrp/AsnC family leucine-responsive transcriptional regulator
MVNVPSIASYEAFSDEVFSQDANIASFETLIALREVIRFDPLRVGHIEQA